VVVVELFCLVGPPVLEVLVVVVLERLGATVLLAQTTVVAVVEPVVRLLMVATVGLESLS
jgi:hypothetical protein